MSSAVAYAEYLPVDWAAVAGLSRKLAAHRRYRRTGKDTRRLTPWSQVVYLLRFLIDGARIKQLAFDNALPKTTAYTCLWEGLDVLAACTPMLAEAIDNAHIALDGTLIPTTGVHVTGSTKGVDLFWSGKHHRHGANLQVVSAPDGHPLWIGEAWLGREHDSTAAHSTGLEGEIALLNISMPDEEHLLVLVDRGYGKFRDFLAVRVSYKCLKGSELTDDQRRYNRLRGALHALAEKANVDIKVRSRCLDKVSLNPWNIGIITYACLAFFHIERPADSRLLRVSHGLPGRAQWRQLNRPRLAPAGLPACLCDYAALFRSSAV